MRTVIEEYGKAVLAMTVFLFILGFSGMKLFGVINMTGDVSRDSNEMYQKVKERKGPEIRYMNRSVCAGCVLNWDKMFKVTDADGEEIEFSILKIDGRKEELSSYRFPKSGIYEIEVSAEDRYGIVSTRMFRVPVQRAVWGKGEKE